MGEDFDSDKLLSTRIPGMVTTHGVIALAC